MAENLPENFFESEAPFNKETVTRRTDALASTHKLLRQVKTTRHENEEDKEGVPVPRALVKSPDHTEHADVSLRYRSDYISNLKGYFYPPITADYTLIATSEDNAGVWVTSGNTRTKVLRADQWWLFPRDFSKSLINSYTSLRPTEQTFRDRWRKSDKIAMNADSAYLVI